MAPKELSAFERKRLENIETNRALLKDISATTKVAPPKPAAPAAKSSAKSTRKTRSSTEATAASARPTRQSSRIAGLSAEDDTLKRKLDADTEAERERERAKRTRTSDDLSFGGLQSLKVRGAQGGVRTWIKDEVKDEGGDGVKALRERLDKLELYDKWAPNEIKITPQRVYAMGFHPTEDKPIIFAGDKEGTMGVFDASQEKEEVDDEDADEPAPVISTFKAHARTITAFVFSPTDENAVFSSSYDSSIRKVDLAKGVSTQIYAPANIRTEQEISSIEIPDMDPNIIFFSTLHGDFGRHDMRTPGGRTKLWSLSEQKIGGFSLHPRHSHLVATASLDRTMKIWDLRKIVDSVPSLVGSHESRLSVSHAAWSSAGHIATTSYDDTIKLYTFGDGPRSWAPGVQLSEDDLKPGIVIPHNNQTGRWVSILKPQWQRRPKDSSTQRFVVGNMNRFVDVFAADGSQVAQLDGDGITAVPAVAQFHPTVEWVAGGTGSGKLCLWV